MILRRIWLALLVAGFTAFGSSTLITGQQPESTFVAVVRPDGSMIPIAAFDGREWWNRWPEASSQESKLPPIPPSVSTVPPEWLPPGMSLPTEWRLYRGRGRTAPVKALRPIRTSMQEEHTVGLQVDYARPGVLDEPAGAVAVSGAATVGGFVRASRRETDAIVTQLADRLAAVEDTEIARWVKETKQPDDTARKLRRVFRAGQPKHPTGVSLMRAEQHVNGRTYYHLSGEKLYSFGDPVNESCKMNMSFDGAVATDEKRRVTLENVRAFAFAEYCGDPASHSELIATIQVRDQLIWVGIEHLEDGYGYFLTEPHTREPLPLRR